MSNLPKGWEEVKLGDFCDILDNQRIPISSEKRAEIKGNIPYYGANGVQDYINDFIFNETLVLLAEDGGNFNDYQTRPIAYMIHGKSWVNNHTHVLRAKNGENYFLFYSLVHKDITSFINGGTRTKLNRGELVKIPIFVPPLEEQKKIADILSTVDKKIAFVEENINATEELKKGLMQKLLTEGIGHTEFKDSEFGRIPESWEVKSIDSIAKISGRIGYRGYTVADIVKEGEGAITLSPSNIINNKINFKNCTYISFFKYEESPEIKIYNGDILLVKTGSTYGKTAIVTGLNEKATLNPQIVVLKNIKMDNLYLSYLMSSRIIQNQITQTIAGGAIPTLSQKNIEKYKFPIPPIEEQKQIAEILSTVDKKIENLKEKKLFFQELKKGLMQKLLTGELRV
uniref:restriction endonuclease subunit S n=1 Tax=Aliarcobacter sp. TaxID=2321116 RepID=UPI0040482327